MNNDRVRDLGRLALATEIRSAQKYWQITSADDIYPPPFNEAWRCYIIMAHAVIDPQAAWDEAQLLTSFDDGNTKSNTYYWIASRP